MVPILLGAYKPYIQHTTKVDLHVIRKESQIGLHYSIQNQHLSGPFDYSIL